MPKYEIDTAQGKFMIETENPISNERDLSEVLDNFSSNLPKVSPTPPTLTQKAGQVVSGIKNAIPQPIREIPGQVSYGAQSTLDHLVGLPKQNYPEPKTGLGKAAKVFGEFAAPVEMAAGALPLKAAESAIGGVASIAAPYAEKYAMPVLNPVIDKASQTVKLMKSKLGGIARTVFDTQAKQMAKISNDAADIVFDNPDVLQRLKKTKDQATGASDFLLNQDIGRAIKHQKDALIEIDNRLPEFVKMASLSPQGKMAIINTMKYAGVDDGNIAKIISNPEAYLNKSIDNPERASLLAQQTLNVLQSAKKKIGNEFGVVNKKILSNTKPSIVDKTLKNNLVSSLYEEGFLSKRVPTGKTIKENIKLPGGKEVELVRQEFKISISREDAEGVNEAKNIIRMLPKDGVYSQRDLQIVKKNIDDLVYQKEIKGGAAPQLIDLSNKIKSTLMNNNPKYAEVNAKYSDLIDKIEKVIGRNKGNKLFDDSVYKQFRNSLQAINDNKEARLAEDVIDTINQVSPKLASQLDRYVTARLERKNIIKFLDKQELKFSNKGNLDDLKNGLQMVNPDGMIIHHEIEKFVPKNMKYLTLGRNAMAANEFSPIMPKLNWGAVAAIMGAGALRGGTEGAGLAGVTTALASSPRFVGLERQAARGIAKGAEKTASVASDIARKTISPYATVIQGQKQTQQRSK